MKTEADTAVGDWGDVGWRNIVHQLYFLISSICFAVHVILRWSEFQREAQELLNSGRTSRFVKDEHTDSALDKETGQPWPMSLFRMRPRLDRAE